MNPNIQEGFHKLQNYLETAPLDSRYIGYDPFDGLNSEIFSSSIFNRSRLARLMWVQLNKRSPINFRKLLKTSVGYNPQSLGIFISSYCTLYKLNPSAETKKVIEFLCEKLIGLVSHGYSGACWGYNFDWQARAFYQPKFVPMIVPTTYAVDGLLDAYELFGDEKLLSTCESSTDFVLNDLNRTHENDLFAFSYSPEDYSVIYNASLLASKLLGRIFAINGEERLLESSKKSVDYCLNYQKTDGSWSYGAKPYHQWIDNFHTGYNLISLKLLSTIDGFNIPEDKIQKGLEYYLDTFFRNTEMPKYYSNSVFPIDINNPAQLVLTLDVFGLLKKEKDLVERVLEWTVENMQSKRGYFYFQKKQFYTNKIPFMRWSQSWMFYSLSKYYAESFKKEDNTI